jgi:AmmeMemoRadiSam system protein A
MDSPAIISDPADLPPLARQAVMDSLAKEQAAPLIAEGELKQSRGVFVTIHTSGHRLRGCRGTISGTCPDLIEETRQNACSAAFDDPRFPAVTADEMPNLHFEVSVLSAAEPVEDESQLDPQSYGIIVISEDGKKRALMLPGIPHLDTVEKQVSATRDKAGLTKAEPIQLQRFQVDKFYE